MKPFFTFFGGKWRAAPHYPAPRHDTLIEPFAGAAGYAVRHFQKNVILVERDPIIASLWRYLIQASKEDILKIPLIAHDGSQTISDMGLEQDEATLVGFWLNKGTTGPCKSPGKWMRDGLRPKSFWGEEIRFRIAEQVEGIAHWQIIEGSYEDAPDIEATWFIDPPYQDAGKRYRFGSTLLDFASLGEWCQRRRGQIMVCENEGADWLPFEPFREIKSTEGKHGKGTSREAIWPPIGTS